MRKLLMHVCCGPCFSYIQEDLSKNGLLNADGTYEKVDYKAFFYNFNIHMQDEYEKRKDSFIKLCDITSTKYYIYDKYGFDEFVSGVQDEVISQKKYKMRCSYCYYKRLYQTFLYAKENNFDIVSTTLTISPYQNHAEIKRVGEELSKKFNIEFRYINYTPHYREGQILAKKYGLYMQKYCGCIFSLNERNEKKKELQNIKLAPKNICIKRIYSKKDYFDLLLDIEQLKSNATQNFEKTYMYGLKVDDSFVTLAVISHIDENTLELEKIVTKEEYRKKGYAKRLLKSLCGSYKQKYKVMIVKSANNANSFFESQGFKRYENILIKDL